MGLPEAFETATIVSVNKSDVSFARLMIDDLSAWAAAVVAERKAAVDRLAAEEPDEKKRLTIFDRFNLKQEIEDKSPNIGELFAKASTPAGAKHVLTISLMKTGQSRTDAEAIIKNMDAASIMTTAQNLVSCQKVTVPAPVRPTTGTPDSVPPPAVSDGKPSTPAAAGYGVAAGQ